MTMSRQSANLVARAARRTPVALLCGTLLAAMMLPAVLPGLSGSAFGQTDRLAISAQATRQESRIIARQHQYQQRARRLMGELLRGVLKTQLKQLKENQMEDVALYRDLVAIQRTADELVRDHMAAAVELLLKAQSGQKRQHVPVELL